MAGQPAVCRRSLQNGAFRHHPVLILVSTPASTDALLCRFSAAVSLQVLRWLSGLFQKLLIRVAEGMTKSGEPVREEVPRAGVRRRFKRAVSHLAGLAL
jgi:hypothetical protein